MKTIRELLTGPPRTIPRTATALEAARAMSKAHVGAVLVLDEDGQPCGIFTERDLMVRVIVAGRSPDDVRVEEVMTTDLFTATPERRVNEIAREMQARHIRHLPVIESSRVLGVLSLRDCLREHLEAKREEVKALQAYIQGDDSQERA